GAGGALSVGCRGPHVLLTTAGAPLRRWHLDLTDFVVLDLTGGLVERHQFVGPAETPVHLALHALFPACQAVLHPRAPYSLAFAARGLPIPAAPAPADPLGDVPCFGAAGEPFTPRGHDSPLAGHVPSGIVDRPDVYAYLTQRVVPGVCEGLRPRGP